MLAIMFLAYYNACIPMSMYIPMYSYTTYRRYLAIFILLHRKVLYCVLCHCAKFYEKGVLWQYKYTKINRYCQTKRQLFAKSY